MKTLRTYWLQKTLLWLMVLVVFNRSIDAPDALKNLDGNPITLEEDLSINEMESFLEVFLEKGLNIKDAFPEEQEEDSNQYLKKIDFFSPLCFFAYLSFPVPTVLIKVHFAFQHSFIQNPSLDITAPPPELVS